MTKFLGALVMMLSLSLFGAGAVSAFESSPTAVTQDGDKGKKKHGKKKSGKKKGKGKKHGKKSGKKQGNKKKHGKKKQS